VTDERNEATADWVALGFVAIESCFGRIKFLPILVNSHLQDLASGAYQAFLGAYQAFPGAYQAFPGAYQAFPGAYQAFLGAYQALTCSGAWVACLVASPCLAAFLACLAAFPACSVPKEEGLAWLEESRKKEGGVRGWEGGD
jgi:hypothetical protein